jgi:hypothetical protein
MSGRTPGKGRTLSFLFFLSKKSHQNLRVLVLIPSKKKKRKKGKEKDKDQGPKGTHRGTHIEGSQIYGSEILRIQIG